MDWHGWGPRASVDFALTAHTTLHAGGAVTTNLPNLWLDNYVTGGIPFIVQPVVTARRGIPVPFRDSAVPLAIPAPYTTQERLLFPTGDTSNVAANTQIDLQRFQNDLEALTPGHEVQLLSIGPIARDFRREWIATSAR
jgi:hypothetical protein